MSRASNLAGFTTTIGVDPSRLNVGVITAASFVGSGANLTSLPAGQLTGALPAIDGSALTGTGVGTETSINTTGIIAATSFSGDGSALTGIAGTANVSTNTLNVIGVSTFTGATNSNSNVTTTADLDSRYLYVNDIFMGDVSPELRFTDSEENPDYRIRLNSGLLGIRDITNNVDKMVFSTAGVNIPVSNVGVQTNFPTSSTLVGAASSLIGLYIGDGHLLFSDNLSRSGGYYIPSGLNALNAGPVTLGSTMTLDGVWVIV